MIFRVLIDFYQSGNLVSLAWTIQANDRLDAIAGVRCELEALTRCQQFDRLRIRDVVEVGQHFQPIDLSIPVNGTPPAILRAWASYQTYQDWAQRLTRRNGNDCDVVLSPDGVCYLSWGIGTYALPQVGRGPEPVSARRDRWEYLEGHYDGYCGLDRYDSKRAPGRAYLSGYRRGEKQRLGEDRAPSKTYVVKLPGSGPRYWG